MFLGNMQCCKIHRYKIEAIKHLMPPTYRKELRQLIGLFNCYHKLWERGSRTLAPLTKITSIK